jgi:hypothetical protein
MISSSTDNYLLLTVDKGSDLLLMQELWDNYSRLPNLLNAHDIDYPYPRGYIWDPEKRKYYRPSGRAVSDQQLRAAAKRVSVEASRRAKKETQQLIAGTIILAVWYSRMRDLLAALYKTIWLVSIGGFVFDDNTQRNLFYLFILAQFDYFDNFATQIETGEQVLDGRAVSRAGMYGRHGYSEWQNLRLLHAPELGYKEAKRILAPVEFEIHCREDERPGCVEEAAKGWMPISRMIPLGGCQCYDNCLCDIKFRYKI